MGFLFLAALVTLGHSGHVRRVPAKVLKHIQRFLLGGRGCRRRAQFEFAWPTSGQVASLDKLGVVHHPEAAEIVLVPHEALVQGEVRPNRVLRWRREEARQKWRRGCVLREEVLVVESPGTMVRVNQ